jgi:diaminopimelate decarboxylase
MSAPVPPCSLPARHTNHTRRVEELRCALPDDIRSSYAVKANPTPAVVQHFSRQVDGFDVASAGQMTVALDTPIHADRDRRPPGLHDQ